MLNAIALTLLTSPINIDTTIDYGEDWKIAITIMYVAEACHFQIDDSITQYFGTLRDEPSNDFINAVIDDVEVIRDELGDFEFCKHGFESFNTTEMKVFK